jgi:subtilisin family serine protease
MKRILNMLLALSLALFLVIGMTGVLAAEPTEHGRLVRKIVVFEGSVNEQAQSEILAQFDGIIVRPLPIVNGVAVLLPASQGIESAPGVSSVEEDAVVSIQEETLGWGVDRIDADLAWSVSTGSAVKVAIIDTGIDKNHPDLVGNIKGGENFVRKGSRLDPNAWGDDNGHGTHVAGIVAATDNDIGVIGTAPTAHLYGVKVLNRNGSGYLSDVIAGIEWAIGQRMDVINMSLGTTSDVGSLHSAVDKAYAAGIVVVAAAGNSGDTNPDNDVIYPARYGSVIAVAATDSGNLRAAWSSDGPEVELDAPGVGILSTYKGGGYRTLSGTSMATPHVSGTAALMKRTPVPAALAAYDTDRSGSWNAAEIRTVLGATADDLGASGRDNYYGYGLVDAQEAVTGVQTP